MKQSKDFFVAYILVQELGTAFFVLNPACCLFVRMKFYSNIDISLYKYCFGLLSCYKGRIESYNKNFMICNAHIILFKLKLLL